MLFIAENRGFQRLVLAAFRQDLVKDKFRGLERMGDEGFEPATNRLRVYCSTVELVTRTNNHHSTTSDRFAIAAPKKRIKRGI